jgi:cytochrome c oxidase assembly protein subunit 15
MPHVLLNRLFFHLIGGCILIFAMVLLGGATRLTQSGLSIVEWEPILGIIPPLSALDWQTLFQKYQQSPEFQFVNYTMTLEQFKPIFWMEYAHRVLGRVIGLWFLLPMLWWWRQLDSGWRQRFVLINLWVLAQGTIGWLMVKSGLSKDPHVSHYRLALHLITAMGLYAYILWQALPLRFTPFPPQLWWLGIAGLAVLTITWGAFVAGLKAGLIYNSFPDMNGAWIPEEAWFLQPWWMNFLANPVMVQFVHRVLALSTAAAICLVGIWLWSHKVSLKKWWLVILMAVTQVSLGVATLLSMVPITLGVLHQGGALAMVTAFIIYARVR